MAKNNEIFDTETIDLLGNLQSSKKPIKIINDANKQLIIDQYFDGKTFQGSVDSIKESVKISNLSDSIKDKVKNLNSDFWKDLNIAFERDENATSNIIINLPNNKYHIIYEIRYRPWYVSNYKSTVADDFLKNGFNPPSKRATYQFFADWIERVYNAEAFLLTGKFKDYIKAQNLAYNGSIQVFDIYESDAKKGDKEIRKDFGSVFNLPNDPDPALPGPPTQAISGVTNKAPVVDNPNIKLPSQEVKSLTATSATDAIQQATPSVQVGPAISQVQGAASGAIGQAQGAASGAVSSVTDKLNPKGIKPDGLGKDWSPDKFSPESIAGNTKYVDPKTGQIGSTATLAKTLGATALGGGIGAGIGAIAGGGQGALIGGLSGGAIGAGAALGGIGGTALAGAGLGGGIGAVVGGGQGALIGAASGGIVGAAAAKLASVQKDMPKPNIPKPPNTPRIKTVKIPRPDSTKGAQALLNLPKSPTI